MRILKIYSLLLILMIPFVSCKKQTESKPVIVVGALPNAQIGVEYNQSVASWATGGGGTYTWTATGLPAGFSISPEGIIASDGPLTSGTFYINLRVDAK